MPQLDGVRALAIFGVFLTHFTQHEALPFGIGILPWGSLGVWLFFVLSGFLITGILHDARPHFAANDAARWLTVRQFFIRRFLRIFPLYYLVIFAAIIMNVPEARAHAAWLLTYTTNLYVSFHNDWLGHLSHLWSLAVEEQFYLVWPFLVLFLPRQWLWIVIALVACAAPAYRLAAHQLGLGGLAAEVFTLGCLDFLSAGSLLAIGLRSIVTTPALHRWIFLMLPFGLVLGAVMLARRATTHGELIYSVLFPEAAILTFVPLILAASSGSRFTRWLAWGPLRYLGKISYGLYVLHLLVPLLFQPLFARLGVSYFEWDGKLWPVKGPLYFFLSVILTTALAAISWHCFERPINSLKQFVPYRPKSSPTSSTAG